MATTMPASPAGWTEPGPVSPGYWAGQVAEFWVAYMRTDRRAPAVLVRYQRDTDGGASPTAVLLEAPAGLALAAREVRALPLGEVASTAMGAALLPWMGAPVGGFVEPLHDGPDRLAAGHHGRVLELLGEAGVGSVVGRMRRRWLEEHGEDVPASTMRRWIAAAAGYGLAARRRLEEDRAVQQRAMAVLGPGLDDAVDVAGQPGQ